MIILIRLKSLFFENKENLKLFYINKKENFIKKILNFQMTQQQQKK